MPYEANLWSWYWLIVSVVLGIVLVLTCVWLIVRVISSAWHGSHSTT